DSILAWLSNGEYVMDAFTTKFFGSGFFKSLQQMARSGFKLPLPSFNTGGMVDLPRNPGGSGAGALASDIVEVRLNLGGNTYPMLAPRNISEALLRDLKDKSRGSI